MSIRVPTAFGPLLVAMALCWLFGSRPAAALPELIAGFDLDQVSTPRFTLDGFQSVTTCTLAPGQTPSPVCSAFFDVVPATGIHAGYLTGQRPSSDIRTLPFDAELDADLWSDGHLAPFLGATLRISGLTPGASYMLLIFARGGGGSFGSTTSFQVDGSPVESVRFDPQIANDVSSRTTLMIPVEVGPHSWIDVGFGSPTVGIQGIVNGFALAVPEPSTAALVTLGLVVIAGFNRVPRRRV